MGLFSISLSLKLNLMDIAANIQSLKSEIPESVKLLAVSKTRTVEEILEAYNAGHRFFGENKVQELIPKHEQLPKDIEWHLIGHLQSNKVKYVASFVNVIHSVDSLVLLREIDKHAQRFNRTIDVLLQVHIAKEETKFGLSESELFQLVQSPGFSACNNVRVTGLMGMATFTSDEAQIRSEFRHLVALFHKLKNSSFQDQPDFRELSMGMSSDFRIAVEEGSTMIRVGSLIFGEREYK